MFVSSLMWLHVLSNLTSYALSSSTWNVQFRIRSCVLIIARTHGVHAAGRTIVSIVTCITSAIRNIIHVQECVPLKAQQQARRLILHLLHLGHSVNSVLMIATRHIISAVGQANVRVLMIKCCITNAMALNIVIVNLIVLVLKTKPLPKSLLTSTMRMKERCSTRQIDEITFDGTIHEDTFQRHVLVYCVCIFINC